MSNFIISYDFQHLKVLFYTSLNNFSQLEAQLQQLFSGDWFFPLENSMKFKLSIFHLLCFVSMSFLRSLDIYTINKILID